MKIRILTHKSGIRHLIMLGIMILGIVALYILVQNWNPLKQVAQEMVNGKMIYFFAFAGVVIGASAIQAILLYWSVLKLTGPYLKKSFFAFLGWLPLLRKYDTLVKKEQNEFMKRKERRQWDRENPHIEYEEHFDEDALNLPFLKTYDKVLKNPVHPVREEAKAFLRNVARRLILGVWSVIVALGTLLVLCIGVTLLCVTILSITDIRALLAIAITMIIFVVILFIIHPILSLLRKNSTEETTEAMN